MSDRVDMFSIPIYKGSLSGDVVDIENTWDLLNDIWGECEEGVWSGETGRTTAEKNLMLHTYREMEWIIEGMLPSVVDYWDNHLRYAPSQIQVSSSWANLHFDNDVTMEHSHSDGVRQAHVASVFYLKKQEGGDILFCNPLDYIHRLTPLANPVGDAILSKEVKCLTGDFLLFPGWLRHKTSPSNGKRVAISVNFYGNHLD